MALSMRLSRGGRKKRPFYRIVVADKRMARDGRYIERLGTYNPLLANDDEKRVTLNEERIKYWLGEGAEVSPRVHLMLAKAGLMEKPAISETPKKSAPSEKTKLKIQDKQDKLKARAEAEEAAKAEAEAAPAEEAPTEEATAEAAPAEEAAEAPAEEAKDEAPAEEAKEEVPAEEKVEEKTEKPAAEAPAEEAKEEEKKEG